MRLNRTPKEAYTIYCLTFSGTANADRFQSGCARRTIQTWCCWGSVGLLTIVERISHAVRPDNSPLEGVFCSRQLFIPTARRKTGLGSRSAALAILSCRGSGMEIEPRCIHVRTILALAGVGGAALTTCPDFCCVLTVMVSDAVRH